MKDLLKWSVLIASWILFAASQDTNRNSWKRGKDCNGFHCTDRRAHFDHTSFLTTSYTPYRSYKLIDSYFPTNFVIYIRNIKNPSQRTGLLQLCDINTKCESLTSTQDQIFIYKNVKEVLFVISDGIIQFQVQYYAGCNILDQTNVDVQLDTGSYFTQPGRCWIFIPRVYDGPYNQHTAATNIFLTNVNLPANSTLSLCNVITGQDLMNFETSTDFDLTSSEKNDKDITYQKYKSISSIFLAMVETCPADLCSDISFKMNVQALSERDYQCFMKKQFCELGTVDVEEIRCDEIDAQPCFSHLQFRDIVDTAMKSKKSIGRMRMSGANSKLKNMVKCKLFFIQNKLTSTLCGEQVDCSQFGDKCQQYCKLEQMYMFLNLHDDGLLCRRS